jgi:hypothetical protein
LEDKSLVMKITETNGTKKTDLILWLKNIKNMINKVTIDR